MDQQKLGYSGSASKIGSVLQKLAALAATAGLLVVSLMFSIVFFAVALSVAAIVLGTLWWKTRALRARMQEHGNAPAEPGQGRVIEGELVRDPQDRP